MQQLGGYLRCNDLEDVSTLDGISSPLSALLFQNANDPDEQMLKSCTKKLLLLTCQMVWLKADAVSNMLFSGFKSCNCEVTACIWRTLKLNQSISKCNEIYSPSTELETFFLQKCEALTNLSSWSERTLCYDLDQINGNSSGNLKKGAILLLGRFK